MEFTTLTEKEVREFSEKFEQTSFMQTVELAHLKEDYLGSKTHYVGVRDKKKIIAGAMILEDETILHKKKFYSPRGLLVDYHNFELLEFFTKKLKEYIKEKSEYATSLLDVSNNIIVFNLLKTDSMEEE